jgi:8-hydroxy-5-deazaflavin:NADPH oxidoreductase
VSKPAHAAAAAPGQAGRRLGIIGAGKAGIAIARAAVEAGYDVAIAGSGPASRAALTVEVLAPGARAASTGEVIRHAGVIILAVPAHRFRELSRGLLAGKIVVDAMNYWEPVDGTDAGLATAPAGTSRIVQDWFPAARVVKSLNQLGYHEFEDSRRERGAPGRVAMAAAGDDPEAVRVVMQLIDRLGFDPVDAGALDNGTTLEPGGPAFGVAYTSDALSGLLTSPGQEEAAMPKEATARLRRYHASSLVRHRGSRLPARRCARPGAPATGSVRRRPGSWFPAALRRQRVRNGRIVSVHEYFDSAPIARIGIDSWLPKALKERGHPIPAPWPLGAHGLAPPEEGEAGAPVHLPLDHLDHSWSWC